MPSLKKNFAFNIALTLSTYIINIFLFPYVSRTLGVETIGKIGFVTNTISYFSLFAMLGIGTVGIREIAACGIDKEKRSRVFSDLITISFFLTALTSIVYIVSVFFINRFQGYRDLLIIGIGTLFFTSLLIEWLYQGLEQFAYITKRSIFIKIIYALTVILLVKSQDDYLLYFALTVLVVILNSSINLIHSRHYVHYSWNGIPIKRYYKSIASLGLYSVMVSMYTTFNVIFLGFVCDDREVGLYYTSIKIFYILLGVMTAFTRVMLPRMSLIIATGNKEEFNRKIQGSFDLVFVFAMPIAATSVVLAPEIITLISGVGFEGAIVPFRIVMPMIVITGLAQIYIIQVLAPMRKEKVMLIGAIVGAIIGVLTNIILVKDNGAIGSAIVLLCSEICGDSVSFLYVMKKKIFQFPTRKFVKYAFCSLFYAIVCLGVASLGKSTFTTLFISVFFCGILFLFMNWFVLTDSIIHKYLTLKK